MNGPELTMRRRARPLDLLRQAAGSPRAMLDKAKRLAAILAGYADRAELDARLRRLHERGLVDEIPTRIQLVVGAIDMLRFWISPAAADYYGRLGIDYGFHQILRLLDEPASLADPVGFFSTRDGIIGHLMQVVHANPIYDLELLQMLAYVRAYRRDRSAPPMLRDNIEAGGFGAIERTFGSLPSAMRYFRRLPDDALGAAMHVLLVREFPRALARD